MIVDDHRLLQSLLADVATSATILRASPDAVVAHCPGWSIADLIDHHGGVLRWAEAIVRTGDAVVEQFRSPAAHPERHDWYMDAAEEFVATASRSHRERACWTFGRPPGRAWFWTRRQAIEAAIHRWDAELATGPANEIPTDLACLAVTEVIEDLYPRQVTLGRTPALSVNVELRAEDVDRRWMLGPSTGPTEVTIEAPASAIALFLWRRVALDDPRIHFTGPERMQDDLTAALFAP